MTHFRIEFETDKKEKECQEFAAHFISVGYRQGCLHTLDAVKELIPSSKICDVLDKKLNTVIEENWHEMKARYIK